MNATFVARGPDNCKQAGGGRSRLSGRLLFLFAAVALAGLLPIVSSGGQAQEEPRPARVEGTIADRLAQVPDLEIFASLVEEAELSGHFRGPYPTTLFAPTNEAFAEVEDEDLDRLRSNPEELRRFILLHVLEDDIIIASGGILTANGALNPIDRLLYWPDLGGGED